MVLVILDAFGISGEHDGNPVYEAATPTLDEIEQWYPFTTLQASGVAVGLPVGEAGNSEVGHLTMGSGRVVHHHLPRIISSIHDGTFYKNELLLKAAAHVKQYNSRLHIAGLISSGSVHSYSDHLNALLDVARREELPSVFLHIFTDGKDAPPTEGLVFLSELEARMKKDWPQAAYATVQGRFYGMDRGENWDRTQTSYELMTLGKGQPIMSVSEYLQSQYKKNITDEFIEPAVVVDGAGQPTGLVRANDALIFLNFREDSMRQIARAFILGSFNQFVRQKVANLFPVTMTGYETAMAQYAAFPSPEIQHPLAQVLGEEGLTHLHVAETQKYAHVTYFFNGGREQPFPGESRVLIDSLHVEHFDEVPAMKASEITATILKGMDTYDVIIANFANADVVGHSGNFKAGVRAVEVLDESVKAMMNGILNNNGVLVVTGDHGGIELKRNAISGEKRTEHSTNPVPLYMIGNSYKRSAARTEQEIIKQRYEIGGILTDVAPTMLEILGLRKPVEMTGTSLLPFLLKRI